MVIFYRFLDSRQATIALVATTGSGIAMTEAQSWGKWLLLITRYSVDKVTSLERRRDNSKRFVRLQREERLVYLVWRLWEQCFR